MRLFRVDTKGNKVEEIKTFEPLKGKYAAIQTAVEADREGGKYLLDEGTGSYYEFDVKDGQPHFLPGNEGLHEGVPEKHLARIQRNPDSLDSKKERYGDFHLDSPGSAPEENPFNTPPPPSPEEIAAAEAEAAEGREDIDISADAEAVDEEAPAETGGETEETVEETPEDANVDNAEGESSEETDEAAPEGEVATEETVENVEDAEATGAEETDEVDPDAEVEDGAEATDGAADASGDAGGEAVE